MNAIEVKEKRKKLGITQKELAILVGVSTQTINGYENGKVIPSTKLEILDTILNKKSNILTNKIKCNYNKSESIIINLLERIHQYEIINAIGTVDIELINHNKSMIRLLKQEIEIRKEDIESKN